MMPSFLVIEGADEIRSQFEHGIRCELGFEPFLRQFDTIAGDPRETDFAGIAIGTDRFHLDGSRGGCGGGTTGFAVKSNGIPSTSAYSTLNLFSSFSS